MKPAPPVTRSLTVRAASQELDPGVVAHHEAVRPGGLLGPGDLDVLADERVLDARNVADRALLEHDGVLELGAVDDAVGVDRGEGTDVAVDHARALADDRR